MRIFLVTVLAAGAVIACRRNPRVEETVAQVERVRAGVSVADRRGRIDPVPTLRRLTGADTVHTDHTGRAILSLDGGGRYVLDHDTTLRVPTARMAVLESGRLWIAGGGEGGRHEDTVLRVGDTTLHLRGARASVERRAQGNASVSVLAGEIAFESGTQRGTIRVGETANLRGNQVSVAPHHFFEDWTGGMADDLPTTGSDASGLGAVAARRPDETGAPRWPMVMQRLDAQVTVRGDLAITTLEQTFFNPSADTVEGIYTFNTPPGAVLQSFGVDRRGRIVEGVVRERHQAAAQYQAQVYQGSTHDPALLEWDAPGRYHARLYPIAPGATRRVRVRYTQWLNPDPRGRRIYRLPLASLETRVGELRADFDLGDANVSAVRTGAGARMEDGHLYVAQSDVVPRSDLVVELEGLPPGEVSAVRARGDGDARGGYVRFAVQAPVPEAREAHDEGVDLVVVVDHSAATDQLGLRLEQAFVESLMDALDPRDRVLVLAGDVSTRALGYPAAELRPATTENRRAITEALSRDRLGGATDLGAMIAAAHRALTPERNGAVVYVGDGHATVGEQQLSALRQLMARLTPRPRFYAVAVGEDPDLDVLSGLAAPAGYALRISRRSEVARAALDLVEHASRPLVRNFRVSLGNDVQHVYPAEPVDLPAGEPLVVVGRYAGTLPSNVTVRAIWRGREVSRTLSLIATEIDDERDLRYRWATMRLEHLLARGESRPVIVQLGTSYGLITPHTSLYVPSEDEVALFERDQFDRRARSSASASVSLFDLLPLVGCSYSREPAPEPPASASTPTRSSPDPNEGMQGARSAEGRMGAARSLDRSARYAIRSNSESPDPSRNRTREDNPSGPPSPVPSAAAPAPPAQPAPPSAATEGRSEPEIAARPMRRSSASNAPGETPGDDSLGRNGPGGGGGGEGTIALDNIGTIGHGSGQVYGSGSGYGVRSREAPGPLVRAVEPSVTGQLSPLVIRRVVLRNLGQVTRCHEQGLAQDPELHGRVVVHFIIGSDGTVMSSQVQDSSVALPSVGQCIANAVRRWQFPPPGGHGVVAVNYPFNLLSPSDDAVPAASAASSHDTPSVPTAEADTRTPARCSDAAAVPLAQRISLWRERLDAVSDAHAALEAFLSARRACELPAWPDRVAMLRLMMGRVGGLDEQIALYRALPDTAARSWVRSQVLRTLARNGELARAQDLGLGRLGTTELSEALGRATTPQARLAALRELVRRYPDDLDLMLRLLDTAVEARSPEDVHTTVTALRAHPQADARVRTACGEALLAIGDEREARRTFSEIVEFAPDDPLARRRLGDIALSHGWADEAYRQFQMLAQMQNDAPDVLLRQAMAARMAGRLDEAVRLAERVAEQSSTGSAGSVADMAATWIGVELAMAASAEGVSPEDLAALRARWRRSPAARAAGAVRAVLRWYHPDDGAELWVTLPGDAQRRSDAVADRVFIESTVLPDAPASLTLEVRRGAGARARGHAELIVVWNEGTEGERVQRAQLDLDDAHPRYVFSATPSALSDVTPAATSIPGASPTAQAPRQATRTGGAT